MAFIGEGPCPRVYTPAPKRIPGKDKEANYLPAPKGPFTMIMRLLA